MGKKKLVSIIAAAVILFVIILSVLVGWGRNAAVVKVSDSSTLDKKLLNAMKGQGVIELTEADVNGLIDMSMEKDVALKKKINDVYARIVKSSIELNGKPSLYGFHFYVRCYITPKMSAGSINISIDRLYVGKIRVPSSLAVELLKRYLPSSCRAIGGNSIGIGSKIFMFDIDDISVGSGIVKIKLKDGYGDDNQDGTGTTQPTPAPGAAATPTPKSQTDSKTAALQKTNRELYAVLKDVGSSQGKDWINLVISINSKMIKNPNGSYGSEISSAKSAYRKLPSDVQNEIKNAALNHMDMSSVRYLVNVYGM